MDANLDSVLNAALARILVVEKELVDLRETVKDLKDEIYEVWMGGTD